MAERSAFVAKPSNRLSFACVRCAERKVKCDRQRPCTACVRHQVDCVFVSSNVPRKRKKRVKVSALTDRLKQYEALLHEQGIDPRTVSDVSDFAPAQDISCVTQENSQRKQAQALLPFEHNSTRILGERNIQYNEGQYKFVESSIWKRVIDDSRAQDMSGEESNCSSDVEISDDDGGFVLLSHQRKRSRPPHPPCDSIHMLWNVFKDNVDPIVKVIHAPTLEPAIFKAAKDHSNIPRSLEALMFGVYSTAVMSLTDEKCRIHFSTSRQALLTSYVLDTEAALSRCKFMSTTNLVVLQALVLHIISVRDTYEPRAVWTLTGVAIRIAQVMGLERDGDTLGLSPFESEMRRRVWWQLKLHDFRTAELCGLSKFRDLDLGSDSTKWPTNVNDDQLYPGVTSLQPMTEGVTDIVFFAFRCELTKFASQRVARFREQGKDPSQWNLDESTNNKDLSATKDEEIQKHIKELQDLIETKYLRYCDPSQPIHLLTLLIGRYGMNVVRFLTHHPRRWAKEEPSAAECQLVWDTSIKLLEQHNVVYSYPDLQRFAWSFAYFQQWHAFLHVLDVLQADPLRSDADKAWQLIGSTYAHTPAMILDMKKPFHAAVGNLCLKAYGIRETALQSQNIPSASVPDCIVQLRQRRETARAKREVRSAERSQRQSANPAWAMPHVVSMDIDASHSTSSMPPFSALSQQPLLPEFSFAPQPGNAFENDPFSLFNDFQQTQSPEIDIDMDFLLALNRDSNTSAVDSIDWEQWDIWLADSNVMRPLPT